MMPPILSNSPTPLSGDVILNAVPERLSVIKLKEEGGCCPEAYG
jgi:hypothetical protein